MTQQTYNRVRIYSHITQSRFLHIEDTLNIGKLRIFAGTYRQGQGMSTYTNHFLDMPDARVIFGALARVEQGFKHIEYKGTPAQTRHPDKRGIGSEQGRRTGNGAVSRVLSVAVKGDNVYIELKTGPGKLTATGAIAPNGKPDVDVNVGFKLYEARRLAETVLAYIHAWDVLQMLDNRRTVSQPSPYLLVPVSSGMNSNQVLPAQPAQSDGGSTISNVAKNGRPVTSKAAVTNGAAASDPVVHLVKSETAIVLKYGDGSLVDAANVTETNTFQKYVTDRQKVPESKASLLVYYRQRAQASALVSNISKTDHYLRAQTKV